jgi:putative glutamine amidotransferase
MTSLRITYTERDDKFANYVRWMKGDDASIEIVKLSPEVKHEVSALDGVVFSGGVDIHPRYYNGQEKYAGMPSKFKEARDEFEFELFEKAVAGNIPVIGVCRGLQLINVFQKGTLTQDLAERNNIHESFNDAQRVEHDRTHKVKAEDNTLLREITTATDGLVNSAHHQSIDQLGDNLVVNSYSDDGIIEGIEWKDKSGRPFMLALQWHPERMDKAGISDSPFSKSIRDRFIKEISSNRNK